MEPNDQQYERIAQSLDGEPIELTDEEKSVAEEIRRSERELGTILAATPPARAMIRARRRMQAELARPRRARMPSVRYAAVAAAAAAAIIIALAMFWHSARPRHLQIVIPPLPTETLVAEASKVGAAVELEVLEQEIEALEAEMLSTVLPRPAEMDADFDEVEQEIDEFWMEEPFPGLLEG
ncbi:MAG TPA: hypothetical protein VMZ50_01955 [Phycisphaerae bacterium]|nr:hypothetical protein [Phycisphaerae bacterium]